MKKERVYTHMEIPFEKDEFKEFMDEHIMSYEAWVQKNSEVHLLRTELGRLSRENEVLQDRIKGCEEEIRYWVNTQKGNGSGN